jgi:PAS domain S-box-containing protein
MHEVELHCWETLSESEERARLALEASGAGVWSWDAETGRIDADQRYRDLYGFTRDQEIDAQVWQQRILPEDREQLLRQVGRSISSGQNWREEFRVQHPQRGVRLLEGYGRVRRDPTGRVLGLIGINLDITERDRAGAALRQSQAELKAVVDGAADGIITIDEQGTVRSFNRAAVTLFGYAEKDIVGKNVGLLMGEEDRSKHDEHMRRYMETGAAHLIGKGPREMMGRRRDGTMFPIELGVSEIDQDGKRLFIGIVRDVTQRKQAEATQRLLMDELNHRVNNTLATVQAMAVQTLRTTSNPVDFVESFRGRLQALSQAHHLLTKNAWQSVDLHELLAAQLVLRAGDESHIEAHGPAVWLKPQQAVHLGLVLHELGTNARKYGALSCDRGRVVITWDVAETPAGKRLRLEWQEQDGPSIAAPPQSQGLGSLLISRGIEHTLRGGVRHVFPPSGARCELEFPLN